MLKRIKRYLKKRKGIHECGYCGKDASNSTVYIHALPPLEKHVLYFCCGDCLSNWIDAQLPKKIKGAVW